MIDEAPLLTIRKTFERPQAGLVAAFKGVPTAQISDAEGERAISWLPIAPGTRPVRALELDPGLSGKSAEACRKRLAGL